MNSEERLAALEVAVIEADRQIDTLAAQVATGLLLIEQLQAWHNALRSRVDAHEMADIRPYAASSRGPWRIA